MNTWTDSGMSEAGLVGAMLALGLDTAPRRSVAPDHVPTRGPASRAGARIPAEAAPRHAGRGRFPAPERSAMRFPTAFPPPPLPEPKLASDDLSGWTDGFLAGGSPLSVPTGWDEPSPPTAVDQGSTPRPAELTSMLDRLLDPGRPPAPAASEIHPAAAGTAGSVTGRSTGPNTPAPLSGLSVPDATGSGPLDGPLEATELEPAQLDFEFAPLDPDALEPALLEPVLPGPASDERPSLAELAGLDRPGLGPVVLGPLGLESMDLDASVFAVSPEFPPPTEPSAAGSSVTGSSLEGSVPEGSVAGSHAAAVSTPESPGDEPVGAASPVTDATVGRVPAAAAGIGGEATGGAHRGGDDALADHHASGAVHHRRDDDRSALGSLDDSPLYSALSRRRD